MSVMLVSPASQILASFCGWLSSSLVNPTYGFYTWKFPLFTNLRIISILPPQIMKIIKIKTIWHGNCRTWKKYKTDNTTRKKDIQFYLESSCGCEQMCVYMDKEDQRLWRNVNSMWLDSGNLYLIISPDIINNVFIINDKKIPWPLDIRTPMVPE